MMILQSKPVSLFLLERQEIMLEPAVMFQILCAPGLLLALLPQRVSFQEMQIFTCLEFKNI